MIEDIVGNNGTRFIIAAGAVALGLLCLVAVLWFIRNRPSSPFIRGGKNRQPRLAVLDAAAIDTRRRLVLVRRDDVEHLIMIGGPTDVVIESRILAQAAPQAASISPSPETAIARPTAERRIAAQPETKPVPVAAPVSGMGQVLYGENVDLAANQVARSAQPTQARPRTESPPIARPAGSEQARPIQAQPRPQPAVTNAMPAVQVEKARSPEDILEAARTRVLSANQPLPAQRSVTQTNPVAAPAATPTVTQGQKEASAIEFERILDAEVTGDLGKLTAHDIRVDADRRANAPTAASTLRQEPRLGDIPGSRTEPTLEDEMNRMLHEIAVNRKN